MADHLIGTFIGEYEIIGQLGVGGMGVVYRARQFNLAREVALKLLPQEYGRDTEYIERFLREARAAARLNHPNIVQVYDAGVYEGHYFFVMELIQGKNVGDIIREETRISERDAIRMILQASLGLGFAHHAAIIHRDVKPENLILNADGTVKICDLGLAKWGFSQVDKRITQMGMTIGTPFYIAPEQVRGVDVDHRADIYSLGATFYHMLTGKHPFEGTNYAEIMLSHLKKPFPDPRAIYRDLSFDCVKLLQKMTEKQPEKRFQTMDEVVDAACMIIGAREIQGMVSPEVAKRLSQRFMERSRARVSTKGGSTVEIDRILRARRIAALAGWLTVAAVTIGALTFLYEKEAGMRLAEAQKWVRKGKPRAVRGEQVKPIEINLPTEIPTAPVHENDKGNSMMRDVPEPRTTAHDAGSAPASARDTARPTDKSSGFPKQMTLEIPGHLLWQVSIHPSMAGGDHKSAKPAKRIASASSGATTETALPQVIEVSSEWRGLMKFDLHQMIKTGPGAPAIRQAWLSMIPAELKVKAGNFDIGVFRLLRPWGRQSPRRHSAGSGVETLRPVIGGVNWQQAMPDERWGFDGGDKQSEGELGASVDRAKEPTAVMTLTSAMKSGDPVKIDVTKDVRSWAGSEPNHGWIFIGKGFGHVEFFPGGDSTGRGPKLILTFE
jgi:serine/threonine-protein kinase